MAVLLLDIIIFCAFAGFTVTVGHIQNGGDTESRLKAMESQIHELSTVVRKYKAETNVLNSEVKNLQTEVTSLKGENGYLKQLQNNTYFVGFSAYKQNVQIYEQGDTIIFEGIILNDGEGYNTMLNRFECPVSGIYYVAVTFVRQAREDIHLDVVRNGVPFLTSSDGWGDENPYSVLSNSAMVRCFPGDYILVQGEQSGVVRGEIKPHTSFTVMLVHQTY